MEKPWLASYPQYVPEHINFDPTTHGSTVHLLAEATRQYGNLPAYISMGSTISFQQLFDKARQMATFFQQSGLKSGDRVALSLPNILQYPIALFGAHMAGLVVVPCNPLYTSRELGHQLHDSGARLIVVFENFAHTLEPALVGSAIEKVVVASVGDELGLVKGAISNFVVRHLKKMVPVWNINIAIPFYQAMKQGQAATFKAVDINLDDPAFLQYTGGTTGVSKGAVLSHRNIVSNVMQARAWIGSRLVAGKDKIITALPLYHIFALTANCLTMMTFGVANVLIINARDINSLVAEMKKHPWAVITAVNTLFNLLLQHQDFRKLDFSRVAFSLGGGTAVQKAVASEWHEVTKKPITQAYGLSETSPAVTINRFDEDYNGAIGYPLPSTMVTIRDETGKVLPLGEVGEVCVKGPQVMRGYWQKPVDEQGVFWQDQVFRTGDIGRIDERGLIYIVDRIKDMVLVSGFNVYPNEIEDILMLHPAVKECGVIGLPDKKTGEAICAFVVCHKPQPKSQTSESAVVLSNEALIDKLIEHCREKLINYKVPKRFYFIEELPKTNVGKVLRRALKDLVVSVD